MKAKEVIALIAAKGVKVVDFKFCDIHGRWQHISIPANQFNESTCKTGLGFDGSSIRGWRTIESSDMLLVPDLQTAFIDPFTKTPTLSITCDIEDPITREPYNRSVRGISLKAEAYLSLSGIADTAYFGPEAEFFIFDGVRYDYEMHKGAFEIYSNEGIWTSSKEHTPEHPNLGYKIRPKEGYLPVSPQDKYQELRNQMALTMIDLGMIVECQHHEVATGGQAEIDLKYTTLHKMADQMCLYKYVVKNVAYAHGKTATFMPKPLFGDNGSGMHVHSSIWKDGKNLMAGSCYAGLSQEALWYIGGILRHAPALCAICNPTNNSYKRLVPGYEAPVTLAYSARNRSAVCRIPMVNDSPESRRVEFRCPDPTANPYLAFSAILMAGLDGVENKIDPGKPFETNLYTLPPEIANELKHVPDSLRGSLEALQEDHLFLMKGDVFTKDFIDNYLQMKWVEYDAIRLRPHPYEFYLYYDL